MLDLKEIKNYLSRAKILDCTLRDGGYTNNWNFSVLTTENLLSALSLAGIEDVEVGFRKSDNTRLLGPHAYSKDQYLERLDIPSNLRLWAMVNANEFSVSNPSSVLKKMFQTKTKSVLSGVRIASTSKDLSTTQNVASDLANLGYTVAINLMQGADASIEDLTKLGNVAKESGAKLAYLADTNGSMSPISVIKKSKP
jgi:4-hydroxy 2-oxovalerate aldolase